MATEIERPPLLGQRLRHLRTQNGKTLRAQARDIGIAPSSLSALENNRGGVSLRRLQLVAEHFGVHISDLLGEPAEVTAVDQTEIIRNCMARVRGVRRGHGVVYQLIGSAESHMLQPYLISFEPSGGYEDDKIGHTGEEFAYVLQGEVELVLGKERHQLSQGDLIRFRPDRPHAFRNLSTVGMAIVIGAATPPW